jgi:hypothetical protein
MRRGGARPHDGLHSNEGVAVGHGMKFTAAMLLVIATAIAAGLFVGVNFGK